MQFPHPTYEAVIGLEVHAQLQTESKLFCGDATVFGADPNTQVSPISLGHPGTLPYLNREAVVLAIRLGLACHAEIHRNNYFVRKNYFYPDLPKGYQISQHTDPICVGGFVDTLVREQLRRVRLQRIHLEEDAGKSLHDLDLLFTALDYNRAGTPLVEIVTEPDLRSAEEAFAFLTEMRKRVRWVGVCDGNMETGSLRCDANISVRRHGETQLGTRVEVKNLNSIRNVKKAIEVEIERLIRILEAGGTIRQETRSFDADRDTTFTIRTKEDADDYRYFAEPDLAPLLLSDDFIEAIRASLPALPEALELHFSQTLGLSDYDARQVCESKELADYFQAVLPDPASAKPLANWLLGPVRSILRESGQEWTSLPLNRQHWTALIGLVESGQVSFSIAAQKILPVLLQDPARAPSEIAHALDLMQDAGNAEIRGWVREVLAALPEKVTEYRRGRKGLIGLFMGEVKKRSRGKADPQQTTRILEEMLQQTS